MAILMRLKHAAITISLKNFSDCEKDTRTSGYVVAIFYVIKPLVPDSLGLAVFLIFENRDRLDKSYDFLKTVKKAQNRSWCQFHFP